MRKVTHKRRFIRLDNQDIAILVSLWEQGCRIIELDGSLNDNRRRLYRMKRKGLCGNSPQHDDYGPGHHKEYIWGISPEGIKAVNLSEQDHAGAWSEPGFYLNYTINEEACNEKE